MATSKLKSACSRRIMFAMNTASAERFWIRKFSGGGNLKEATG